MTNRKRCWIGGLAALGLLAVLGWGGFAWFQHNGLPRRWGVVENNAIFRSGQIPARQVRNILVRHNIRLIIDLTFEEPANADQQAERRVARELGIQYLNCPMYGGGVGEVDHYARAIAALVQAQRENRPALIHCAAGVQRTGVVVAVYRLLIQKKPPALVVRELRQYGWDPNQNQELRQFLNSHLGAIAAALKAQGIIEQVPEPLPQL